MVIILGLIGDVIYKRQLQARYYRLHQWLSSQDWLEMLFIKTITGLLLQVTSVVIISGLVGDVIYKDDYRPVITGYISGYHLRIDWRCYL